jgi:hypothetical protein
MHKALKDSNQGKGEIGEKWQELNIDDGKEKEKRRNNSKRLYSPRSGMLARGDKSRNWK